ncbi:MAG: substrate-binding domain-containing protein [Arenicella sp.]
MKKYIISFLTLCFSLYAAIAQSQAQTTACLIVKTKTNPFFVKMIEGAEEAAKSSNIKLLSYSGRVEGDVESQVKAIDSCVNSGAKGLLITPSDSKVLAPHIRKARNAGLLVIALDTPFDPYSIADATFATNNFKAGRLIGEWAAAKMGESGKKDARIALLDLTPPEVSVDYLRNNGFLYGFGIDIGDPKDIGDEKDARIVGNALTYGSEEGGREAMETLLKKSSDINLVYTINEPAAAGAYDTLKRYGKERGVLVVSVDGGCQGIRNVSNKVIGATSMQFPLLMASKGVEAIKTWVDKGVKPGAISGLHFFDTGVKLVTDTPVEGIDSISSAEGLGLCWG